MRTEKQIKNMRKSWEPENKELANKQKEKAKSGLSPFVFNRLSESLALYLSGF